MLAWNDTREAAQGAWAAMPFAAKAEEVTVVSVTEAHSSVDPDGLVRALARRGIGAEARTLDRGKASVGESLLAAADERKCDLLVMGAYGQSRLQELILGGATKHVLKHARIPLLMVH
jgi:nucleotide-binding universal stress UspA family protein